MKPKIYHYLICFIAKGDKGEVKGELWTSFDHKLQFSNREEIDKQSKHN